MTENEDTFINKILFKKYKINKIINKGNYGKIYEATNIKTKEKVAIKTEKKWSTKGQLEKEGYYLFNLKAPGFPKLISFGKTMTHNILIEELLGKNLRELQNLQKNGLFTLKDTCMIGIQIIDRLEYLHSKYIIHRDIKRWNFLIGINNPSLIYMIDFGLAIKYRSSRTKNHIKFTKTKGVTGNFMLLSVNGMKGMQQSRRDDLESLFYMLFEFIKGKLPWNDIIGKNMDDLYYKMLEFKSTIREEKLCESLPYEFLEFLKYCKALEFTQKPNYDYLRGLLNRVLLKMNEKNDLKFSWIPNEKMKIISLNTEFSSKFLIKKRSISPREKLLKQIENSISDKNAGIHQKFLEDKKGEYEISNKEKLKLKLNNKENSIDNLHFKYISYKKNNNISHDSINQKANNYIFNNSLSSKNNKKNTKTNKTIQINLKNFPNKLITRTNTNYNKTHTNYQNFNSSILNQNFSQSKIASINNNINSLRENNNNLNDFNFVKKNNTNHKLLYKSITQRNGNDFLLYRNKLQKFQKVNSGNFESINSNSFAPNVIINI